MDSGIFTSSTHFQVRRSTQQTMCSSSSVFCCLLLLVSRFLHSSQGATTVYVIPHSHCDAGYRKTFDAYFTDEVKSIINSVLDALQGDPEKRFVWEEVSFLSLWWQQASLEQKDAMRKLQAVGQLEFIGGGWVMHDEAVTSLRGILNQMTEGLIFLNTTLGVRPRVGWHIDPFGHSSFTPELFSRLNYDMFVLNRIPDPIKQDMKQNRDLEFHWRNSLFNRTIFAHVLDSHYSTPVIFGLTVEEKAKSFYSTCQKRLRWYKTDNLLLPFGNDFHFQDAPSDFKEMDEILEYIANHPNNFDNITVRYSTLSEYFDAVSKSGVIFNQRNDDFFPYIACSPCFSDACEGIGGFVTVPCGISDSFWSGFYTSKPAQKLLERELESSLHALEQLNAMHPDLSNTLKGSLNLVRNTSGLLQHHDAITGTSFPDCYTDYNERLERAMTASSASIATLKSSVLCGGNASKAPALQWDSQTVLKGLTNNNRVVVVVQNTLETNRSTYTRISLPDGVCVKVMNGSQELPSQQVDDLLYIAVHLQPMALHTVWLEKIECHNKHSYEINDGEGVEISNRDLRLEFNGTGHLVSWSDLRAGVSHSLSHLYLQEAEKEDLNEENVCDGTNVYTFVPDRGTTVLTPKSIPIRVTAGGPLVWEVQQEINPYINTTWRLFAPLSNTGHSPDTFSTFAEWQTKVGPLPSEPYNSVLSQLRTENDVTSFTTYASGYYPVRRSYKPGSPLQANTYPLVGRAVFPQTRASGDLLAIVTRRPLALSSSGGSALDLMLHRRIDLLLDKRGDDSSIMDDPMLLGFPPGNSSGVFTAQAMREHRNPPSLHFSLLNSTTDWTNLCHSQWLPMASPTPLPLSVQSHSMRLLKKVSSSEIELGIRLINVDEAKSQDVDIGAMFREWNLLKWRETTPDFLQSTSLAPHDSSTVHISSLEMKSLVLHLQRP